MAPWRQPAPDRPWDVLQADSVLQFHVWRDLVFKSWAEGNLPFWNHYQLAGTPLAANSQSGAFYPPHVLLGFLHAPTVLAIRLLAWFHLFWAGLGAYFLCRRMGGNKLGAALAGASFCLSPFMIGWTPLASVISTVSWIPWILGFILYLFSGPDKGGRARGTAALITCSGLMILAGHLQFVAYGFLAAAILAAWLTFARRGEGERPIITGARVGVAIGLGLCLAAIQLMPVLGYSKFSHRANTPTAEGYQAYLGGAIKGWELVTLPAPTLLGHPGRWSPRENGLSTYWPAIVKPGANFAESAISAGPLVLLLLFCWPKGGFRRREHGGMLLIALFGMLMALGTPLNQLFYFYFPGWSSTGSPGRAAVLAVLAACAFAGVAASRLIEEKPDRKRLIAGIAAGVLHLLLCLSGTSMAPNSLPGPMVNGQPYPVVADAMASLGAALPSTILGFAIASAAVLLLVRSRREQLVAIALCALVPAVLYATDMITTSKGSLPAANTLVSDRSAFERVAVMNASWNILGTPLATAPPNTLAAHGIHDLAGYDSLLDRDTVAMLGQVDGQDPAPPENGNMMFIKPTVDLRALADAGATELWVLPDVPGVGTDVISRLGSPSGQGNGLLRYRLTGPGRASLGEIASESPSSVTVRAVGPGRLVLKDRMMPGWTASIDGQRVPVGGELWREVDVPAGEHTVVFSYQPPEFVRGAWLSAFAVAAMALILLLGSSQAVGFKRSSAVVQ